MLGSYNLLAFTEQQRCGFCVCRVAAFQEADIAPVDDPGRKKADQVEAAIGEMSTFHEEDGIYAEGVDIEVAPLPDG